MARALLVGLSFGCSCFRRSTDCDHCLDENRLAVARRLVPRVRTILVDRSLDTKSLGAKIIATLGTPTKLVIECTGVESSIHTGIYIRIG